MSPCSEYEVLLPSSSPPASVGQRYNSTTCTMHVTGPASLIEFSDTLKEIEYQSTADEPVPGDRTISFRFYDNSLVSADFITTVLIQFVEDAPRIILNGTAFVVSLTYTEGMGNLTLAPSLLVEDDDSTALSYLRLSLSIYSNALYLPLNFSTEEYLSHPQLGQTVNGISISTQTNGVLFFSGNATLSEYQYIVRRTFYFREGQIPLYNNTERQVFICYSFHLKILLILCQTGCVCCFRWDDSQ